MWGRQPPSEYRASLTVSSGFRTTCQFNSKIFNHEGPDKHLWCSDPLENCGFDVPQTGFYADNVALTLNEEGDSYTVKSAVNDECIMSLTVTRKAPGFQVGKDGTSYFGTDPENPWGSMRHVFWPRCSVTGTIQTKLTTYTVDGRALFIHALQGMKPHHLAARWNFANFQTPTYSAVLMEFTTPKSYGKTVVSIGGIVKDNEIVCAGTCTAKHLASKQETEYDWPEPTAVLFEWSGQSPDGQDVSARIEGDLPHRTDRIDVLSHLPGFVKSFISGATGLKPHIFQVSSLGFRFHRPKECGSSSPEPCMGTPRTGTDW